MSQQSPYRHVRLVLLALTLTLAPQALTAQTYWPGQHLDWERRSPAELGLDAPRATVTTLASQADRTRLGSAYVGTRPISQQANQTTIRRINVAMR